jgi:hypothetical protein
VGWVTGDEVYGGNPKLRAAIEERGLGYALAVARSAEVRTGAGTFRADALVKKVSKRAWQKLSAGRGAKAQRFYDCGVIDPAYSAPGLRQVLIRRNRVTGGLACLRCYSTDPVPLTALVKVAGSRWRAEETLQSEKGLAGLDEHQVRRHPSWIRWVTLVLFAHAFLAAVSAEEHARRPILRRTGPAVLQGDAAPVQHPRSPASPPRGSPVRPVRLAPPSSGAISHQPLPATSRGPHVKTTMCRHSANRPSR